MIYDAQEFARVWKPTLLISAAAWTLLLMGPSTINIFGPCLVSSSGTMPSLSRTSLASWTVMLIAMMAPVLIQPVYHIHLRSFAHRRWRSIAIFLVGYTAIWMAFGIIVLLLLMQLAVKSFAQHWYLLAGVVLLAFVWQFSPIKQRCLNRCLAHPALAAFGSAADANAFGFGITHGIWCTGSCWLLMILPMLLARGNIAAMAIVAVLIFSERLEPPNHPCWACRGIGKVIRIVVTQLRLRVFVGYWPTIPPAA